MIRHWKTSLLAALCSVLQADQPDAPLVLQITENVVASDPRPFGLNQLSGTWGRNSIGGSTSQGFEAGQVRERWFVDSVGSTPDGRSYFDEQDLNRRSAGDGFWDAATLRIYRPQLQADGVNTYQLMDQATVQQSYVDRGFWPVSFSFGAMSFPANGGSVALRDVILGGVTEFNNGRISEWYQHTDLRNGTEYVYTVRAVDRGGNESSNSNVVAATPQSALRGAPMLMTHLTFGLSEGDTSYSRPLEISNGEGPFTVEVLSGLPSGLEIVPALIGRRHGLRLQLADGVTATGTHTAMSSVSLRITDDQGQQSVQTLLINPAPSGMDANDGVAPQPPSNLQAQARDGAVQLSWDPSPSSDVVGYIVYRSRWQPADQLARVELNKAADLQEGDLVIVEKEFPSTQLRGDASLVHDRVLFEAFVGEPLWPEWDLNDGQGSFDVRSGENLAYPDGFSIDYVPHPGTLPAAFQHPGQQCVRLSSPSTWSHYSVRLFTTDSRKDNNSFFYRAIEPGKTYHLRVWVYQSGVPGGQLELAVNSHTESASLVRNFVVPEHQWTLLEIDDLQVNDWDENGAVEFVRLRVNGGGTLYVDAAEFYEYRDEDNNQQNDDPPHEITSFWKAELSQFFQTPDAKRPLFRYWGLQSNGERGVSLDEQLKPVMERKGNGSQDLLSLPQFLELCLEVGADPWIICAMTLSEQEMANLFEYLAGDGTSPYGALRILHRGGLSTPWTDEFSQIYLEIDNETWNSLFAWTFYEVDFDNDGSNDAAQAYGMLSEMLFRAVSGSALWQTDPNRYEGLVSFVVNGFHAGQSYGGDAARYAPSADVVDLAPYLGGWESGSYIGGDTLTTEGFAKWLVYSPWRHYQEVNGHVQLAEQLASQRPAPYRLAVYEGGPGYDLPGPNNPSGEVPESYGKSLAAAITTLDSYLYESYRGYADQAFFGFAPGSRWTTHSMGVSSSTDQMEFRSQATWLAQQLRNNYVRGGMTEILVESTPTVDLPAEAGQEAQNDVPLVACYAFQDGQRYSVLLLSRKMPEVNAQGEITDLQVTPVRLKLPFTSVSSVSVHKVENDPRRSNVPGLPFYDAADPLEIESLSLSVDTVTAQGEFEVTRNRGGVMGSDGVTEGIAGGSIYLFVFEADSQAALPQQPQAQIFRASTQPAASFQQAAEFSIIFDRPVEGLELADLDFSQSSADLSSAEILLEPLDPLLPQTLEYRVRISGIKGGGILELDLPAAAVQALSDEEPNDAADGSSQQVRLIAGTRILDFNVYDLPAESRNDSNRPTAGVIDLDRWFTLDLNTAFYPISGTAQVYAGIRATLEDGAPNQSNAVLHLPVAANREGSPYWPNESFAGFFTEGSNGKNVTSWGVFLFKKEDFQGVNGEVTLNAGSELFLDLKSWPGNDRRFHFILRDGTTCYLSEQTYAGESDFTLTNFVDNPLNRWAVIPFTLGGNDFSTHLENWQNLTYTARSFTDVTAVGFAARVRAPWGRERSFRRFHLSSVTDFRPYVEYDLLASRDRIPLGTAVNLSVSAIDADSSTLSCTWNLLRQPQGSSPSFSAGLLQSAAPGERINNVFLPDRNGEYEIQVVISDGEHQVQSRRVILWVEDPPRDQSYLQWQGEHSWGMLDASLHADPDGDGCTNFIEFIMDRNPLVADAPEGMRLPTMDANTGRVAIEFRLNKRAAGIHYAAESVTDLTQLNWHELIPGQDGVLDEVQDENIDGDGTAELRRISAPLPAAGLMFMRMVFSTVP